MLPHPRFCTLLLCSCTKWWVLVIILSIHRILQYKYYCDTSKVVFSWLLLKILSEHISVFGAWHFSEWFQLCVMLTFFSACSEKGSHLITWVNLKESWTLLSWRTCDPIRTTSLSQCWLWTLPAKRVSTSDVQMLMCVCSLNISVILFDHIFC